jgi:hypothetical protein
VATISDQPARDLRQKLALRRDPRQRLERKGRRLRIHHLLVAVMGFEAGLPTRLEVVGDRRSLYLGGDHARPVLVLARKQRERQQSAPVGL